MLALWNISNHWLVSYPPLPWRRTVVGAGLELIIWTLSSLRRRTLISERWKETRLCASQLFIIVLPTVSVSRDKENQFHMHYFYSRLLIRKFKYLSFFSLWAIFSNNQEYCSVLLTRKHVFKINNIFKISIQLFQGKMTLLINFYLLNKIFHVIWMQIQLQFALNWLRNSQANTFMVSNFPKQHEALLFFIYIYIKRENIPFQICKTVKINIWSTNDSISQFLSSVQDCHLISVKLQTPFAWVFWGTSRQCFHYKPFF